MTVLEGKRCWLMPSSTSVVGTGFVGGGSSPQSPGGGAGETQRASMVCRKCTAALGSKAMSSQPKFNLTCSADCFSFSPTGNGCTFRVYSTKTFYMRSLPLKLMGDVISLDLRAAFCKAGPFKLFLTLEYLIFFVQIPNSPGVYQSSFLASTLLFYVLGVRAHAFLSSQCILPVPEASNFPLIPSLLSLPWLSPHNPTVSLASALATSWAS